MPGMDAIDRVRDNTGITTISAMASNASHVTDRNGRLLRDTVLSLGPGRPDAQA